LGERERMREYRKQITVFNGDIEIMRRLSRLFYRKGYWKWKIR